VPTDTYINLPEEKQNRIFEAALNEFSKKNFSESKLSNIVKEAKIPRGSIYQYFEDKLDLYKYVFNKLGDKKLYYMKDIIHNPDEIPFLVLIRQLYTIGIKYAIDNPKGVKMAMYLYSSKDVVFDEVLGNGLKQAKEFYAGYIETDKRLGRINPEIDTDVFAEMITDLIASISFNEMKYGNTDLNFDKMMDQFDKKIYILEKGILIGEKNV
jgi:AcrR family transcriptional regulator